MDLRILTLSVSLMLMAPTTQAKDIYKCQVNGTIKFTEEKCDANAKPIVLKGLAAPLKAYDLDKLKGMDERLRSKMIEDRITLRQKRIKTYRKRMQDELKVLQAKHSPLKSSIRDKNSQEQLKKLADSAGSIADSNIKGTLPDQMNTVITHYKTLIQAEQFQIEVLLQELRVYKQMKAERTSL